MITQDDLFIGHDALFIANDRGAYGNSVTFAPFVDIGQEIEPLGFRDPDPPEPPGPHGTQVRFLEFQDVHQVLLR